jgi:hypothetical protein
MRDNQAVVTSAYDLVRETVESIRNNEPATIAVMSAGDVVRQGDLYLVALDRAPKKAGEHAGRQLAPGDTQGSRHVASGDCEIYSPETSSATNTLARLIPATKGQILFLGPVIKARGPVTIEHPEHGWRSLPAGVYQVVYQRSFAAVDQEIRRQMD